MWKYIKKLPSDKTVQHTDPHLTVTDPDSNQQTTSASSRKEKEEAKVSFTGEAVGDVDDERRKTFGTKKAGNRHFIRDWENKFAWLEYDNNRDKVFCKICKHIWSQNKCVNKNVSAAFVEFGFCNWKKAIEKFNEHEKSRFHRECMEADFHSQAGTNVLKQLSTKKSKEMDEARTALVKIIGSVRFLATQGLAIRGHNDESSNILKLLKLRAEDSLELDAWLQRDCYKWISHDIVNEMLSILSHAVLNKLVSEIKENQHFSLMVDETTDCTTKEQVSFCVRTVDANLEIQELFLGFYETPDTTAQTLFNIANDVLIRLQLPVSYLRGQCFDGASNVAGIHSGLQKKIRVLENRALFVHCQAHSLNLVTQDSIKNVPAARDAMNLLREIIGFIKHSPKRLEWFKGFQDEHSKNLRPLCPTRWVMRYSSLQSLLSNYSNVIAFLDQFSSQDSSEAATKASGFLRYLEQSDTLVMVELLCLIFQHLSAANKALQGKTLHLKDSCHILCVLEGTVKKLREQFDTFWLKVDHNSKALNLEPPREKRKRKLPARYDGPTPPHEFSPKENYRQIYIEVLDNVLSGLKTRFDVEARELLTSVEHFLLTPSFPADEVIAFYGDDFNSKRLEMHRDMFHDVLKGQKLNPPANFKDVVDILNSEGLKHMKDYIDELHKLVRIVMVIPITTCESERSFSMLRRLKSYLRSTMTEARLNHIALLNAHSSTANCLDLNEIATSFILRNQIRQNIFSCK